MAKNTQTMRSMERLTTILVCSTCLASWTTVSRGEVKAVLTARPSHRPRQARTDLYDPVTGSRFIGFRNASGSRDYLNPRTNRLYLGFKNRSGRQELLNPRRGTWLYGFRNPNGSSDYLDPRTGRWVVGVNASRRSDSARGSYQKRGSSTKAARLAGPRKVGFRLKRSSKPIGVPTENPALIDWKGLIQERRFPCKLLLGPNFARARRLPRASEYSRRPASGVKPLARVAKRAGRISAPESSTLRNHLHPCTGVGLDRSRSAQLSIRAPVPGDGGT